MYIIALIKTYTSLIYHYFEVRYSFHRKFTLVVDKMLTSISKWGIRPKYAFYIFGDYIFLLKFFSRNATYFFHRGEEVLHSNTPF